MDHLTSFGIRVNNAFGTKRRLLLFRQMSLHDGPPVAEDIQADCLRHWGLAVSVEDCQHIILMWKIANNK